jgi:hypothetical protein
VPTREPFDCGEEGIFHNLTSTFDSSAFAPPVRLPPFPFTRAEIPQEQVTEEDNNQDSRSSEGPRQSRRETSPLTDITCPSDNDSNQESEISASEIVSSTGFGRQVQMTPLPHYSPHLPPIDRTKTGEGFYADLCDKRLIAGYDQDRFSCWCHVAKIAENPERAAFGNLHIRSARTEGNALRFQAYLWFGHAVKCSFYEVSLSARLAPFAHSLAGSVGDDGKGWKRTTALPAIPAARPKSATRSTEVWQ